MFRSLRSRLLLTYLLVGGLVLAIVGVGLFVFLVRSPLAVRQTYQRLEGVADGIAGRSGRLLRELRPEMRQQALERLDREAHMRVLLLGPGGELLADSRLQETPPPADLLARLAQQDGVVRSEYRDDKGRRWLYVARAINSEFTIVLIAQRPTIRVLGVLRDEFITPLLQAGAVALVASVLLAWLVSRWVAAPLQGVVRAARSVAAGDYSNRPAPGGPSEVESLALAFNEMVDRVQGTQQAHKDFVANVSHELKTPLTSIQGFAQAILDGAAADPEAQRHAAQVIYDESDRLRRLVEDLLDLARMDAGQVAFKREPVDIGALLRGVAEKLSLPAAEKEVKVIVDLPPLPTLVGDGDRLAQVFTNLVDNAVKHTPEGGKVALRADVDGGWVSIHVDDTGPGIPPEQLSRIFERFYQVDKARPGGMRRGAGLGLAISSEIVHAHGGRLVAQSKLGRGSRFTVQLPIVRPGDRTMVRET